MKDVLYLTAPQKLTLLKAKTVSDHREATAGTEEFLLGELTAAARESCDATRGTWQSSQAGTAAAGQADATWERVHLRTWSRGLGGEGIPALP